MPLVFSPKDDLQVSALQPECLLTCSDVQTPKFVWINCAPLVFVSLPGYWFRRSYIAKPICWKKKRRRRRGMWGVPSWSRKRWPPHPALPDCLSVLGEDMHHRFTVHRAVRHIALATWEANRNTGSQYQTFLLLCAWQLWKHRHDVVFRSQ